MEPVKTDNPLDQDNETGSMERELSAFDKVATDTQYEVGIVDAEEEKRLKEDVREVVCPVYASVKLLRFLLPNEAAVMAHRILAAAAGLGMLLYDPDMEPLPFMANTLLAAAYSTSAAALPYYARAVKPGGALEKLGMGTAMISKHDKQRLDRSLPKLSLVAQLPIFLSGILFMISGLFKVGQMSVISGRVITPAYGVSLFLLGFSTAASVQLTSVAGFHTLKIASILSGQDVTEVIQDARKHAPSDPLWAETVAQPALRLATHTMPVLSDGYGKAVGLFTATFWLASLGSLTMFLENYSPGILGFCLLFAFMPLVAALDVAHTSTYCDHLREELNRQRLGDLSHHLILEAVEQALDRLNQKQGLGFVVYNVVVDKITLERTFMTLVSALSTVLPFIWALKPPLSVDGQNLSTCELTPQEANVIRGLLTQDSSNITCWYNMTVNSILEQPFDFATALAGVGGR